ncbi:hypothetical protein QBC35DRAFT_470882 [Podospora australis]|uniref:Uncharacterized protein n=1 Tax=Podospora australis TaxID=1536484 RepID=A0AAN7ALV4_9PEZI|nr:hypothetical protein QBC35DRAFT_470882 [Podospora australis]
MASASCRTRRISLGSNARVQLPKDKTLTPVSVSGNWCCHHIYLTNLNSNGSASSNTCPISIPPLQKTSSIKSTTNAATNSSSTTTPRPAFSAPAFTVKTPKAPLPQDIIDDSSPISEPDEESPPGTFVQRISLPEPIEINSSLVPPSSLPFPENDVGYEESEDFEKGPSAKRRRISITTSEPEVPDIISPKYHISDPESEIIITEDEDSDEEDRHHDEGEYDPIVILPDTQTEIPSPVPSSPLSSPPLSSLSASASATEPKDEGKPLSPHDTPDIKPKKNPIFHAAPRFRQPSPSSLPAGAEEQKPAIFSPEQRKGKEKYVPFGLASELRDWLVDVKGSFDNPEPDHHPHHRHRHRHQQKQSKSPPSAHLLISEVKRGGDGMTLISGSPVTGAAGPGFEMKAILAGEGVTNEVGLGGRNEKPSHHIKPGAAVAVTPPAWDIELGQEGRWAVAYRWEVVDEKKPPP